MNTVNETSQKNGVGRRSFFLLAMAGCGGLLFDFGGTIINPAIPYLESLGLFTTERLSHLTSAAVLGAAVSGLAAGAVAEWIGRKKAMLLASAIAGLAALPICLGGGAYAPFYAGRLLQGVAAGLVGVVVPMYLAETLDAANRGKGAGVFQFMDVAGILFCSLVGVAVVRFFGGPGDPATGEAARQAAWKAIFWTSAAPALVFFIGALGLPESPVKPRRCRRGAGQEPRPSGRGTEQTTGRGAGQTNGRDAGQRAADAGPGDSLLQRRYVAPFLLAVAVLVCNQATGCNAIAYFALKMLRDAGLGDSAAGAANVSLWAVMLAATAIACTLVDSRGRKFLLKLGTAGIVVADIGAAFVFLALEKGWLAPSLLSGWAAAACLALFIASFSIGPGVVVWLALSEIMPDRIRANGMAIGLFLNMMVAWLVSDRFLIIAERHGYAPLMFTLAAFAATYFAVAAFLLPETKGKTLAEIEEFFK